MTLSVSDWQSAWTAFAILAMFYIQSYVFLRVYICGMRDGENKSMWTYEENKDLSLPTMSAKFMTSSISLSLRFFLHLRCCLFLGRSGCLWKLPELFLLRRRKREILIPNNDTVTFEVTIRCNWTICMLAQLVQTNHLQTYAFQNELLKRMQS